MQKDLNGNLETCNTRTAAWRGMPYEAFKTGIPAKSSASNRKKSARKEVSQPRRPPELGEAACQVNTVIVRPGSVSTIHRPVGVVLPA